MLLLCHVQTSEWSHTLVCLNVKELLAWRRRHYWSLDDSNWMWTHNHLVRKRTLNGWMFVYELSGCGFESCCCHLEIILVQWINYFRSSNKLFWFNKQIIYIQWINYIYSTKETFIHRKNNFDSMNKIFLSIK